MQEWYNPTSMAADTTFRIKTHSILDDYEVQWRQRLGCGISGPVRPCRKKGEDQQYALKCLLDRPRARLEVNMHLRCSGHRNIVNIYDIYANEVQFPGEPQPRARLLVVMELMDGGELFDRISQAKYFTEKQAARYTKQIAQAIQRCHSLNIAHRDIKPENLLLKDNTPEANIKLSDFGFAKVDDGSLQTPHFTPYYVAPQVLEAQKQQARQKYCILSRNTPYTYDKSCDMWSLGVIIYIMLCGYPPFYSETPTKQITKHMKRKIMAGQYEFPEEDWRHISMQAQDIVKCLLTVDPMERLDVDEVLNHPWLSEAPETILQSPAVMLDKGALEAMQGEHSWQLMCMRMPDKAVMLKPIQKINNPILRRRNNMSDSVEGRGSDDEPATPKRGPPDSNIQAVRDLIAHLILPPKDEATYDALLKSLTQKACSVCSDSHKDALMEALTPWEWDGETYQVKVERQGLAHALSEMVTRWLSDN